MGSTTAKADPASESLRDLVVAGDAKGVAEFLRPLDEQARRGLVAQVRALGKSLPESDPVPAVDQRTARLVAGFGLLGGAAALADFVRKAVREDWYLLNQGLPEEALGVLAARRPDFLGEVPEAVAARLGFADTRDGMWESIDRIATLAQVTPRPIGPIVCAWAKRWRGPLETRVAAMRADPRLGVYVAALFGFDQADILLSKDWFNLTPALVEIAAADPEFRLMLLDGVLRRCMRAGSVPVLGRYLDLWRRLEPGPVELAQRYPECAAVIGSSVGSVAAQLQADLERADAAGLLSADAVLDVARGAVGRPEKGVVLAQLRWLGRLAVRSPQHLDQIVDVASAVTLHPALDLRLQGEKFLASHRAAVASADASRSVGAVPSASASPSYPASGDFARALAPYVPSPPPVPIADVHELAEVFGRLWRFGPDDPLVLERVLSGFVELAAADIESVRLAIGPVSGNGPGRGSFSAVRRGSATPSRGLVLLLDALGLPEGYGRVAHADPGLRELWPWPVRPGSLASWETGGPEAVAFDGPNRILHLRMAEIAARLGTDGTRRLVSLPTRASGAIDPDVLVERIARAEAEGWAPWPLDLEQALLRVSPLAAAAAGPDDTGAGSLTSPAGLRLAEWLARGPGDFPAVHRDGATARAAGVRPVRSGRQTWREAPNEAELEPRGLIDLVREEWEADCGLCGYAEWALCRTTLLPHHRDLTALTQLGSGCGSCACALPSLSEADGGSTALLMALARTFVRGAVLERVQAVDAALILAQRGQLDGTALGGELVFLEDGPPAGLRHFVGCLRELAVAGAWREAWDACAAMIPALLPPRTEKPVNGTADLLYLAADLAAAFEIRAEIPGLAPYVAAKRSNATGKAARHLHSILVA